MVLAGDYFGAKTYRFNWIACTCYPLCSLCYVTAVSSPTGYSTAFKAVTIMALLLIVLLLFLYSASLWVLLANNNILRPL